MLRIGILCEINFQSTLRVRCLINMNLLGSGILWNIHRTFIDKKPKRNKYKIRKKSISL